jgi:hypothetical protein
MTDTVSSSEFVTYARSMPPIVATATAEGPLPTVVVEITPLTAAWADENTSPVLKATIAVNMANGLRG